MRRYTIDLDAPPGGAQPAAPTEPAAQVALPPVTAAPGTEARAQPGEAAQPGAQAPAPARESPPPAVSTPLSTPPQTTATTPAPVAAPKPAESAPRAPVGASVPTANVRGNFAVQLGSFVSRENAERLVHDMTAKGFSAFVAPPIKTNGRDLYRVRVGPTRDRASAEALAAQLRRIGQPGSVVSIS
jgi:DedD protein